MSKLERTILRLLKDGQECDGLIEAFENCNPASFELYGMKARSARLHGDLDAAYAFARQAVEKNPYNLDAHACLHEICDAGGLYIEALKHLIILNMIAEVYHKQDEKVRDTGIFKEKIDKQAELLVQERDIEKIQQYHDALSCFEKQSEFIFGVLDHRFWSIDRIVGNYMLDAYGNARYTAIYPGCGADDVRKDTRAYNPIESKLELQEVLETTDYTVGDEGEYLLPVLSGKSFAECRFTVEGQKEFVCRNRKADHFNYYRIPPRTRIQSEQTLLLGNPIALKQNPVNKKLILNIFIDGLSQKVLEEENFCEIMPYTYRFFKKGVICTNVYAAAEWTLPSLASYNSGLSALNHRLIHNTLTAQFPQGVTLLAEYFKERGYTTAKIDGDWRSTISYGYGRGMDRIIYQHQNAGMKAEEVIPDVLDHMEMMQETNQFIWMTVGDLHDIADGFDLKPSVQSAMRLEERVADEIGPTSVKQDYSGRKRSAYIRQMRHIDTYLHLLYEHIENNYSDDEIVISAFGDHGQGYLVREDEHFLAPGRSKVGMMFRGGVCGETRCDELISTCDYVPIMCRLAGIPLKDENIDGQLPEFFGGSERRKYAFTDSIHPGDPYMASIADEDGIFYFTSESIVEYDGRFRWGGYTCFRCRSNGEMTTDESELHRYVEQVREHVCEWIIYDEESEDKERV